MKSSRNIFRFTMLVCMTILLILTGCESPAPTYEKTNGKPALRPLTIAYMGTTCEAPTYVAYEKGFFAEEGFAVELVKGDFNFIRDGIATGKVDAVNGLTLTWIKPLEQGVDAKVTAALHKGCLYAYTLTDSDIEIVEDLKGKRIGVPTIGGPPMMFLSREMAKKDIDIQTEVQWRAFPPAELELALVKGEVDAVAVGEPFGTIFGQQPEKFRVLLNQSVDAPYYAEYCCVWIISGRLVEEKPEVAAGITRAILRAARYVQENPYEVGALIVERQYVMGSAELNGQILSALKFVPDAKAAYEAMRIAFEAGKIIGVIDANADVAKLTKNAFAELPGVE